MRDPFGHVWAYATRKEDELKRHALDIDSSLNAAPAKAGTS
ncbi:hypothetical protein [Methylocystis sp. H62]|nr:hypothetical protein [Methylocystis sp. H62]